MSFIITKDEKNLRATGGLFTWSSREPTRMTRKKAKAVQRLYGGTLIEISDKVIPKKTYPIRNKCQNCGGLIPRVDLYCKFCGSKQVSKQDKREQVYE